MWEGEPAAEPQTTGTAATAPDQPRQGSWLGCLAWFCLICALVGGLLSGLLLVYAVVLYADPGGCSDEGVACESLAPLVSGIVAFVGVVGALFTVAFALGYQRAKAAARRAKPAP